MNLLCVQVQPHFYSILPQDEQEPPMKKLAIQEEREEDNYTYSTRLRSWTDNGELITEASDHPKVRRSPNFARCQTDDAHIRTF